jgi:hypothetical protein
MKIKYLFPAIFLSAILGACAGSKTLPDPQLPEFKITYGKTGGFTNINPLYTINSKGDLTKQLSEMSAPSLIRNLAPAQLDSVYLLIKETDFLKENIARTGNISNYIEFRQDTLYRSIKWTDNSQLSPASHKLHLYLQKMIKN